MKEFLIVVGTGIVILIFLAKKFKFFEAATIYQLRNSVYRKYVKFNIFFESFKEEDVENLVKFIKRNEEALDSIPYLYFLQYPEKAEKFSKIAMRDSLKLTDLYFVIYHRKFFIFKKLIGIIFCEITVFRIGYISYWLDKDWQGKGIMTLSCKKFMKVAFESLRLEELVISTKKTNLKSMAVAERLGFTQFEISSLISSRMKIRDTDSRDYKLSREDYFNNLKNKN